MPPIRDTEWVRRYWDRFAPSYDRAISVVEKILLGDGRRWVGERVRGEVLDVGVGTGRNLAYYPPTFESRGST
jgi:SAM-dependent methyltransferase